jgi:arylsulfatase
MGPKVMPGADDTYVAYGRGWANVSNTPFREFKHWVHEGGISTPLIAHWPAGIPAARSGQLFAEPGHLIDLMATCVDVGGAKYPVKLGDNDIQPMEGVSLRPAFAGKTLGRTQPIYWEHEGNKAIRDGKWKLVSKDGKSWQLHDIDSDRVESTDLASGNPELVKKLSDQWENWAKRVGVRPYGVKKAKN